MVSVFVLAVLTDRAGDAPSAIALAALAVLAVDPPALFDVSFQLSFGAVIAIFAALARLDRWRRERGAASWRFRDGATAYLLVGVAANLSTMPITAYHFHRISLAGLVANPVLVPVIGNLATPLVLLAGAALPLSEFVARALFTVALVVLRGADAVVACFASWSWASIYVPDPRGWEVAAIFAGIAALLIVPRRRTAWLVAATCAIVVAVSVVATEIAERPRDIRATFLDVGQGDAALIEFPGPPVRRVLVDGGGVQRGTFDVGKSVVAPYLWHRRIRRLDAVVLTHPHPDHFDGLRFVCRRIEVGELWDAGESSPDPRYADLLATLRERGIPRRIVDDSFRPPRGMETLRVIFPASGDGVDGAASLNDRSLVLAIDDPRMPLLLPGDAATALEARIAKNSILPTRGVFKVGHHGQRDAASAALLGALRPRIAVIACGRYNAWGAPSTETLARLATAGATVVRTDRVGSIEIVPAADGSLRVATGTGASFRVP
jgi:competence protein ComEC